MDQREKQIIKEFLEAHERVGKSFGTRHANIQHTLQAVSGMQVCIAVDLGHTRSIEACLSL